MSDSFQSISLAQINQLETAIQAKFPESYKNFLLQHNGGSPEPCVFEYIDASETRLGCINNFLGIHSGELSNLHDYIETYKVFQKRLPDDVFPIANDPGGNLICISLAAHDTGTIYFWDHELEADEGEEPSYANLFFIARSFDDFIKSLRFDAEI
jgi:cell wall assembly regulator SMI1